MRTRLALLTVPVAVAGLTMAPSSAAPVGGTYQASAPVPGGVVACDGSIPGSLHESEEIKLPGAGTLKVDLTGFTGDWDMYVLAGGNVLGAGETGGLGGVDADVENVTVKVKKAITVVIGSCNWAGGPVGTVTYAFTPAK